MSIPLYGVAGITAGAAHAIVRGEQWRPYIGQVREQDGLLYLVTTRDLLVSPVEFCDDYGKLLLRFIPANRYPL